MEPAEYHEEDLFAALSRSGARILLIGRRALVALGLPVLTADIDFWIHMDDIELFNHALEPLALHPNKTPEQARSTGRYVLENDIHVDVLVARSVPTVDGIQVEFESVWARRQDMSYNDRIMISIPAIDDLILTKRWSQRDRDIADIRLLETIRTKP
jgi:hypothetical protein